MKTWWIAAAMTFVGCNGCTDKKDTSEYPSNKLQMDLIEENKKKHNQETDRIHAFVKEKNWPTLETKTGLNYWIYEAGSGPNAKEGDIAVVSYTVELLDGTVCYKADSISPASFLVGQDNVETGLHEAIQLMKKGDQAKLIMPSHLAFGFTGDSGKIPQDASLVYDLKLLRIE